MLKRRIVACVVVKDNWAVQSIGFQKYLPIGKPEIVVEYLSRWNIDEIILIDISASKKHKGPNLELISRIINKCYVPLSYGGGIKSIQDILLTIRAGVEKVVLNSIIYKNPTLINEGAAIVGSQSIIASIDFFKSNNKYFVYDYLKSEQTNINAFEFINDISKMNVGEIFINSVNRDGLKQGYDIDFLKNISNKINTPIIACGGVGSFTHFDECLKKTKVSATCAANIFHFSEHSVITVKSYLKQRYNDIRIGDDINYLNFSFHNSRTYK